MPRPVAFAGVDDWQHIWEVVARANCCRSGPHRPTAAMVYYLGDSIARESTVSDSGWTSQANRRTAAAGKVARPALHRRRSQPDVRHGRDDRQGAAGTRAGQPKGILLIGVGISRFIGPPASQDRYAVDPPSGSGLPKYSPWAQHHYDGRAPLSEARKRELVPRWMDRRWTGFVLNKGKNFDAIEAIIKIARAKGLRPVLFDLPLDVAVVGHGLDKPRNAIRSGCRGLAEKYSIKYLGFTGAIGLPSSAYWDLHHLLRPGYTRWQSRLSGRAGQDAAQGKRDALAGSCRAVAAALAGPLRRSRRGRRGTPYWVAGSRAGNMLPMTAQRIIRTYLGVAATTTLAQSLIWGVNTLFLLSVGLDIFQVMLVNAAYTVAQVIFEVPTGVVADTVGRRVSYLLAVGTILVSTLLYVGFGLAGYGIWPFVAASALLGVGYTFYTGAVDAWMVDALHSVGYEGRLEPIFARYGIMFGIFMLIGTTLGGLLGQIDLWIPYVARAVVLVPAFLLGLLVMRDLGFKARELTVGSFGREARRIATDGVTYGLHDRVIRFIMFASLVQGVFFMYGFYSWQKYFLDLLGKDLVWVTGVIAALVGLTQILGNLLVGRITARVPDRGLILMVCSGVTTVAVIGAALVQQFWVAVPLYLVSTIAFGISMPVKQGWLNSRIPSEQRATIISLDALFGDGGSTVGQVGLGWVSQAVSIPFAWLLGGALQVGQRPAARRGAAGGAGGARGARRERDRRASPDSRWNRRAASARSRRSRAFRATRQSAAEPPSASPSTARHRSQKKVSECEPARDRVRRPGGRRVRSAIVERSH